jgi:glycosyltransferase involved in cell wall biosynthesis
MPEILVISPMVLNVYNATGLQDQIQNTLLALVQLLPDWMFTVIGPPQTNYPVTDHPVCQQKNIHFLRVVPQLLLHACPENYIGRTFLENTQWVGAVMHHYKTKGTLPDVIHSFDWNTAYPAHCLSLYFQRPWLWSCSLVYKKCVEVLRVTRPDFKPDGFIEMALQLEDYAAANAHYLHHVSFAQSQSFPQYLYKTSVIYNGVSRPEAYPKEKVKGFEPLSSIGTRPKKIVFMGRLSSQKNLEELVKCTLPPSMDLVIIGPRATSDGTVMEAIQNACNRKDSGIYYHDAVYGDERLQWLSAADFIVMPSLTEPFGLVALEAMAAHTVVISSFVEGLAEVLDEKCAVKCGTTQASMELAFQQCNDMPVDEYERRIQWGRERANGFSWINAAVSLSAIYKHLCTYKVSQSQ